MRSSIRRGRGFRWFGRSAGGGAVPARAARGSRKADRPARPQQRVRSGGAAQPDHSRERAAVLRAGLAGMARRRDLRPRLRSADCRRQTARLTGFGSFQRRTWNDLIRELRVTLRECLRGRGDLMSKVVSCAEAVARLADGAVVTVSSSSALGCPDAVLAAIRDRVPWEGHPRGLTTIHPIAAGDKYGVNGIDHIAQDGLPWASAPRRRCLASSLRRGTPRR